MSMDGLISAVSGMKQAEVATEVAVRVAKMAMETAQESAEMILQSGLGENVDIQA